ncbi:UNVERIFIED_CONTAM: hypothetical protein Slati_4516300 [Sesamum latifolium]|uniref:Uncharacterized protein n=1 Tax=Sesamum latifolium TaxID=2727402 RepID=A0AAW2SVB9_9LAMI
MAVGSGQGLLVGCVGKEHGACAGHARRRLRAENRLSTWWRWLCRGSSMAVDDVGIRARLAGSVELLTMADQTSLENRVAELESQVQRLVGLLGQASASSSEALFLQVDTLHSRVETLQKSVGEWPDMMGQRARGAVEEMSVLTDVIDLRIDGIQADLNLLKWAVGREEDRAPLSKVKVPDPKTFGGERSAKELENFLWDMEVYFQAAKVP